MPCIEYHSCPTIALSVGKINTKRSMTLKRMINETIWVGTKKFYKAFNLVVSVRQRERFIHCPLPFFKFN